MLEKIFGRRVTDFLYSIRDSFLLLLRTQPPAVISAKETKLLKIKAGALSSQSSSIDQIPSSGLVELVNDTTVPIEDLQSSNADTKLPPMVIDSAPVESLPINPSKSECRSNINLQCVSDLDIAPTSLQEPRPVPQTESSSFSTSLAETTLMSILFVAYLVL
ncbi:hypothetical protein DI09_105p40 [Mitosporidium daphniae]|uniref:Uncharacterized protein n=1 Tax=Mitosporidium daphniae TaxID=1485682 RepID=A0A098VZK4_9MICR|nr:uncharacterized protein DI09_105p40 [Mitosporidium daphniae]KGG53191.1 hypothetical protein DI09_105p40 [Mitosporidium daphniae]|eukprot:XP_013239627.1 uncharacterized protein DI09_105p40 [Mitosporidium daphniae]